MSSINFGIKGIKNEGFVTLACEPFWKWKLRYVWTSDRWALYLIQRLISKYLADCGGVALNKRKSGLLEWNKDDGVNCILGSNNPSGPFKKYVTGLGREGGQAK